MESVQVRLRECGRLFTYDKNNVDFKPGDYVILQSDRGIDYGQVVSEPEETIEEETDKGVKKILRKVTRQDRHKIKKNKQKIDKVLNICEKKIKYHGLDMKLINAEYSFDRSKIIFYFTAEGRIDFRKLVKELAQIFKLRIELRQIGTRDEAKMLGGLGPCGRNLCCSCYMKNFEPVSIRMAKHQDMPLVSNKVSGLCGRLMCCLGYEDSLYKKLAKNLPKKGDTINSKQGKAKVIDVNVLYEKVKVELKDGRRIEIDYSKKK